MLGYVDPVGNTCLHRQQATAVVRELQRLAQEMSPGDHQVESRARALEVLVAAHMQKPHTHLWFIGDRSEPPGHAAVRAGTLARSCRGAGGYVRPVIAAMGACVLAR